MRSGSATISRTVIRGLSEAYGSWKTIWISRRMGRISLAAVVRDVLAVEDDPARGRLEQLHDRSAQRRLAATRLPDDPERLAAKNREIDAVHGLHLADGALQEAGLDREVLDEPFDAEKHVLVAAGRLLRVRHRRLAHGRSPDVARDASAAASSSAK